MIQPAQCRRCRKDCCALYELTSGGYLCEACLTGEPSRQVRRWLPPTVPHQLGLCRCGKVGR